MLARAVAESSRVMALMVLPATATLASLATAPLYASSSPATPVVMFTAAVRLLLPS